MKVCSICGKTENETRIRTCGLCDKHYRQKLKHGVIFERTIFDPNKIEVVDDIAYIYCYNKAGNVSGKIIIDAKNLEKVRPYKWNIRQISNTNYATSGAGKDLIFIHRLLLNVPKGLVVDHIDHNGLNNLESNLRICSRAQNCRNKLPKRATIHPGLRKAKKKGRWEARIRYQYRNISLGTFDSYEEALQARLAAEEKYFGDFRYTGHKVTEGQKVPLSN